MGHVPVVAASSPRVALRSSVVRLLNGIDQAATTTAERVAVRALRDQAVAAADAAAMPTPHELATIGRKRGLATWAGQSGLLNTHWYGVRTL